MSADIKVGDYVVARHTNGDKVYGEVVELSSDAAHWRRVRAGDTTWWLTSEKGWSFELAERPQPPLKDGVYQQGNMLRFRRDGLWYYYSEGEFGSRIRETIGGDAYYRDAGWQYIGPEVSR